MPHDVFISYSSIDKKAADAACAIFEQRGIRCWIAPRDVPAGAEWAEAIIDAIEAAKVMVLIFSSNSNESRQVRREVELAVGRGVTIMPLRLEKFEPTRSMAYFMAGVHWIDALTPPLDAHLKTLADWIKPHIGGGGPIPEPEPPRKTRDEPKAAREEPAAKRQPKPTTTPPPPPQATAPLHDPKKGMTLAEATEATRGKGIGRVLFEILFGAEAGENVFGPVKAKPAAKPSAKPGQHIQESEAIKLINQAVEIANAGRHEEAITAYLAVIERIEEAPPLVIFDRVLAIAEFNLAVEYSTVGRRQDAVDTYGEIVRRLGDSDNSLLKEQVARAMANGASALIDVGKAKEAVAIYDDLLARYGDSYDKALATQVAIARYSRGVAIAKTGGNPIPAYDDAIKRIDAKLFPELSLYLAQSMTNKAIVLGEQGKVDEAMIVYEQVAARFADADDPAVRTQAAKALVNMASRLIHLKRHGEAAAACDRTIALKAGTPRLDLQIVMAMRNKTVAMRDAGWKKEAHAAAEAALTRYGSSSDAAVAEQVAAIRQIWSGL